jgi:predicted CXXCH cytochrome family protein
MIQLLIIDFLIILALPHSGTTGIEPLVAQMQQNDCLSCHEDLLKGGVMHYPAEDDCSTCHESTGASHPSGDSVGFRLMDKVPELCFYCHEEAEQKIHPHQPVAAGNCMGCHDPHTSSGSSLLSLPEPELCLSCHKNISRLIQGKMITHSAIEGGGCISCHQSHGSDIHALLVAPFPEEDYLPALTENFELCFLCHDTDLMEAEETEWGTGFRNGKKNLHRLHMNGDKGRNCRMCHNIHGSPLPFLVEEQVGFGSWEMQMNYIPDDQGGSCLPGCHGKLSYQR